MRLAPTNIEQIGNELAVQWNDQTESFLNLEQLRRGCPCAACAGEPDILGRIGKPATSYSADSFRLISIASVGGYAISLRWADGHSTGIYSFDYLRKLTGTSV